LKPLYPGLLESAAFFLNPKAPCVREVLMAQCLNEMKGKNICRVCARGEPAHHLTLQPPGFLGIFFPWHFCLYRFSFIA
jgi:hypothetical protein